jgi:hypothetical protein
MKEKIERRLEMPLYKALSGRLLVLVIDSLEECDKIDRVELAAARP